MSNFILENIRIKSNTQEFVYENFPSINDDYKKEFDLSNIIILNEKYTTSTQIHNLVVKISMIITLATILEKHKNVLYKIDIKGRQIIIAINNKTKIKAFNIVRLLNNYFNSWGPEKEFRTAKNPWDANASTDTIINMIYGNKILDFIPAGPIPDNNIYIIRPQYTRYRVYHIQSKTFRKEGTHKKDEYYEEKFFKKLLFITEVFDRTGLVINI